VSQPIVPSVPPPGPAQPIHDGVVRGALVVVAIIAVIVALSLGRDIFIPIALSLVFATVLRPVVRRLERMRIPSSAAAAIVVLVTLAIIGGVGTAVSRPVQGMAAQVPKSVGIARAKFDAITARVRALGGGTATAPGAAPTAGSGGTAPTAPATAAPAAPAPATGAGGAGGGGLASPVGRVFGITSSLLSEIVEEVLLVFFLLAAGDGWIEKMKAMARSPRGERLWPSIAGEVHNVVARYLVVTILINAGQSVVIGLALWAAGVPTPVLWAALTFVAELVPYLGGIVMIGLLLAAGFASGEGLGHALLAPGIYLVVTTLQNNLVSPMLYGRGLRLNPTMILISVMFWWMLWGVAGAFLAVPILASLRVIASRLPAMEPLAVLLEE
jgi:predicted PurR-regulated permease PerM